ncbi:MAG: pantoate--beta-alanine ligase [Prevotellaceae bacterium]|nr:pantoate--beta-alanine ligase [Prevotellaceae bacterium]
MKIIHKIADLRSEIADFRQNNKTVGFVPTMGALHQGHLSLVGRAVSENDVCVVSIFVNPTQFNNKEDLAQYPRSLEQDAALLGNVGCALIFNPLPSEIYSEKELNETFEFDFGGLDAVMEGKFRPGHFNGVVQIVSKLFELIQPDKAYFGEKDFQQLAIIRRMNETLHFGVDIVGCQIVREASGLAMSSRNERLTPEQKKNAVGISKVLQESTTFVPEKSPKELAAWIVENINAVNGLEVEYVEIANSDTLQTAENWEEPTIACVTVFCGDVRLIDNIQYPKFN